MMQMATAKKLASGSWRCQVYSHTEETVQPDGTIKKKRIYKSFTCDVKGPKGKRICEKMAAEWAEEKESFTQIYAITFGAALDKYISDRETILSPCTIRDYKGIRKNRIQSLSRLRQRFLWRNRWLVGSHLLALHLKVNWRRCRCNSLCKLPVGL